MSAKGLDVRDAGLGEAGFRDPAFGARGFVAAAFVAALRLAFFAGAFAPFAGFFGDGLTRATHLWTR